MSVSPDLLDRIYEAAIIPELWPDVCDELAIIAEAYSCTLKHTSRHGSKNFVTSLKLTQDMEHIALSDVRSAFTYKHLELMPFSFMRDVDLLSSDEIEKDELKNKILAPKGLYWQLGDVLLDSAGHMITFDFLREKTLGPFTISSRDRLTALRPDLLRAALMSSRLASEHASTKAHCLGYLGVPAAIMGDNSSVVATNSEFDDLEPRINVGADNRLSVSDDATAETINETLEHLQKGLKLNGQSIPIASENGMPALILHMIPIKKGARDVFSKSAVILLVIPVGAVGPPDVRILSGLFNLTSSEARLACELTTGAPMELCAERLGFSLETVRTYLKRIFSKTGTSRQGELVALLSGIGSVKL